MIVMLIRDKFCGETGFGVQEMRRAVPIVQRILECEKCPGICGPVGEGLCYT